MSSSRDRAVLGVAVLALAYAMGLPGARAQSAPADPRATALAHLDR